MNDFLGMLLGGYEVHFADWKVAGATVCFSLEIHVSKFTSNL